MLKESGGGELSPIELDPKLLEVCKDFSGMAIDPITGNLFLCSDESSSVAQLKLTQSGGKVSAKLVSSFTLRDESGKKLERAEGVAFDPQGNLLVLLENDSMLVKFKRQ
jgi:uncharacterized protein YjiK